MQPSEAAKPGTSEVKASDKLGGQNSRTKKVSLETIEDKATEENA